MGEFLSTFVFILPGIMAYFWLQVFGLNPSVKHTAPELSGIAALLWLPVSFITLLVLNTWGAIGTGVFSVDQVWTIEALNTATSDIKYLVLFLLASFIVSFIICWIWSLWGHEILRYGINYVREKRKIAPLSSSASVWEEFFIKINDDGKDNSVLKEKNTSAEETVVEEAVAKAVGKQAVYIVYKIDKPENYVAGSMTKASRPIEVDKALVLEDTEIWMNLIDNVYEFDVKRTYIDTKTGMVVKEIDPNKYKIKKIKPKDS